MKIITYFLPQFHEIEENNKWWGTGFTEWTNLKKAKPLYKNHHQPILPLNKNYYNLLDREIVEWQTKLSKDYGIYGFCYYHYWFSGKKLLEKPAENILKWKDIKQKFCFCWANHSWKKTWNGTMEMLVEQTYGDENEWNEHFEYLAQFFIDSRYIKIKNKPILVVYDAKAIPNFDKRIQYYNEKCKEVGLDGIYLVETINFETQQPVGKYTQGITLREPTISFFKQNLFKLLEYKIKRKLKISPAVFKSEKLYEKSIQIAETYSTTKEVFLGSFAAWDSTPRHSKRGYVIYNKNIEHFEKYLENQKKIIEENKANEFVFFNAWNEWAEGMYLEPDEKNEYNYLNIIKKVVNEKNN